MSSNRVIYQNWIADLGRDPGEKPDPQSSPVLPNSGDQLDPDDRDRGVIIKKAVAEALGRLGENEREFVERYYFMGQGYREIAERSGRTVPRLEALHRRALRKLRKQLTPLVRELFDLSPSPAAECPICASPDRKRIDRLVSERDRAGTWRPVMRKIRAEFGIVIATPQTLIGHEKYH